MSRRKRRPGAREPAEGRPGKAQPSAAAAAPSSEPRPARRSDPRSSRRLALDLGILAAVFAVTVGIAELAGAADLGVAFGIGQVAFAIALIALLLRA